MPQIQYSEKYYDDIYEYRCAIDVASTTNRRIECAHAARWTFASRLTQRTHRNARRHVVLPPDIAKLLPKGRLLSEVRVSGDVRACTGSKRVVLCVS